MLAHVFFFFCESINNTYSPETSGGPMKSFEEDFCISTWPFVSSLSRATFTVNLVQGNPWSALWHVEINFCWGPSTSGVLSIVRNSELVSFPVSISTQNRMQAWVLHSVFFITLISLTVTSFLVYCEQISISSIRLHSAQSAYHAVLFTAKKESTKPALPPFVAYNYTEDINMVEYTTLVCTHGELYTWRDIHMAGHIHNDAEGTYKWRNIHTEGYTHRGDILSAGHTYEGYIHMTRRGDTHWEDTE